MDASGSVNGWVYYSTRRYTIALTVRGGLVVDAPPVARWAIGKDARQLWRAAYRAGARLAWFPEEGES